MIKYLDLQQITALHQQDIIAATQRVVDSGWYLTGKENKEFESNYATYIGTRYCVGCANGLDALILMLRAYMEIGALHRGDEIIVPANTYIATILAITENGLTPVLIEPDITTLQIDHRLIEQHINNRTRAIMLVHLYGRCSYNEGIATLCNKHNLLLFEDNAQAHGCIYDDGKSQRRTGALGHAAAHSFYPGKNLGALGDGGCVTTDNEEIADIIRALGNYGSQAKYVFRYQGRNSRLDEIQAAILNVKLKFLDQDNKHRMDIAQYYRENITNPLVTIPSREKPLSNVYHIFTVLCPLRDRLQQHLADNGIQTLIHYPIPPHKQECYKEWNNLSYHITERIAAQELSLPISPYLTYEDAKLVAEAINSFSK